MDQFSHEDLQRVIIKYDAVHQENRNTILKSNDTIDELGREKALMQ